MAVGAGGTTKRKYSRHQSAGRGDGGEEQEVGFRGWRRCTSSSGRHKRKTMNRGH